MIAADTSVWIDYSKGVESKQSKQLEACLSDGTVVMPLPVLFEILSDPGLTPQAEKYIRELPRLETKIGYWERAGNLRKTVLRNRLKARSMDCLIAQTCIDHEVPLIAVDQDYRHFMRLKLEK